MAATTSILGLILAVFSELSQWIVTSIGALVPIFYAEGALTFMGTLAVCGLAFSVVFLLIGIIQRFLKFGA